jgi:Ca2+-transporting ATPase
VVVVVLLVLLVHWDTLHGLFNTTDLTSGQWLACTAVGATILLVGEVLKAILRARRRRAAALPA